jgi:hypothetical protein
LRDRDGCFSFLSAFASIWRMRSRVTENCWPTPDQVRAGLLQRMVGVHAETQAHRLPRLIISA